MRHLSVLLYLLLASVPVSADDVKTWAERVMFDQKASMSAKATERQCIEYVDALVKAANETATNRFYPADSMPFFNGHRGLSADGWGMMGQGPYTASNMAPPYSVTLIDQASAKALMKDEMVPSENEQIVFPAGKVLVFCGAPAEPFSASNPVTFCECTDVERGCSSMARGASKGTEVCGTPLRVDSVQ